MITSINIKAAVTLVLLGGAIYMVLTPLYRGRVKINPAYGIRIRKAFASEEKWYKINRYGAAVLMYWAAVLVAAGIVCLYIPPQYVLTVAKAGFISIVVPVIGILRYAKKL